MTTPTYLTAHVAAASRRRLVLDDSCPPTFSLLMPQRLPLRPITLRQAVRLAAYRQPGVGRMA
jgi:hypothetical protein